MPSGLVWRAMLYSTAKTCLQACPVPQRIRLEGKTLGELEELAIRACFARHAGNWRRMVDELGIGKATLLRKMDLLGLRKPRVYLHGRP